LLFDASIRKHRSDNFLTENISGDGLAAPRSILGEGIYSCGLIQIIQKNVLIVLFVVIDHA
jgi:hypothetical protein